MEHTFGKIPGQGWFLAALKDGPTAAAVGPWKGAFSFIPRPAPVPLERASLQGCQVSGGARKGETLDGVWQPGLGGSLGGRRSVGILWGDPLGLVKEYGPV